MSTRKTKGSIVKEETEIEFITDANGNTILTKETTKTTKLNKDIEPDFVKLYVSDIIRLKDLPPATEKLLLLIVQNMNYSNTFFSQKYIKELIAKDLGLTLGSLNVQIHNLKKKGILIPVTNARGLYIVDPNLFARGKWEDIKNLRLVIEYNKDGSKSLKSNAPEKLKQLALKFE